MARKRKRAKRGAGRLVWVALAALATAFTQTTPAARRWIVGALAALLVILYVRVVHRLEVPNIATDSEIEALARVIRSEAGSGPVRHRVHIAWATRNLADERSQTIAAMVCRPCGRQQRGRPVSSRLAARDADRLLAEHILGQPAPLDPTGGATHFINPVVQDRLAESGAVSGYKGRTYQSVRRRWIRSYGWEPYYRLGPSLEMWGKKRR